MATYIEEIVQNIYTNCDMKGLNELNEGTERALKLTKSLSQSLKNVQLGQGFLYNISKQELVDAKNRERFETFLQKERVKRAEWLEDHAKKRRKYLSQENVLMRNLGRAFLTYFSFRTFKSIVETGSRLQLVRSSIQGLTKDTQDWNFISQQAFEKGIDLEVVAKGYRNFYSSAKMAGFDKGGIQQMYADILLSTRAIGASTQQTEGALLALEQMLSKGTVSMEELRRQLGNALPGAFEIGAKAMNMTTAEFNKFVKTGQLASSVFVPKFISELKREYSGGFKEISKTVDFASWQMRNAWKELQLEIVSGGTGRGIAETLTAIANLLKSTSFQQSIRVLGNGIGYIVSLVAWLINNLDKLSPFLIPAVYLGVAQGIISIVKSINNLVISIGATNVGLVAMYRNLLGIIGLGLMIEDAFHGFRFWRRLYAKGQEMPGQKNLSKDIGKDTIRGNDIYFSAGGKQYRLSDFQKKIYGGFDPNSDVGRAIRQMQYDPNQQKAWHNYLISSGAKEIVPAKPGVFLEKQDNNTYSVTVGNITVQETQDANTTAVTIRDMLYSMLNPTRYLNNPTAASGTP